MRFLCCKDAVRGKCYQIEVWMIDQHLLEMSPRTLRIDGREVRPETIERRLNRVDLVTCRRVVLPTQLSPTSKVQRLDVHSSREGSVPAFPQCNARLRFRAGESRSILGHSRLAFRSLDGRSTIPRARSTP